MAIPKYTCRCGNKTDHLKSYFIGGARVTGCDKCDGDIKAIKGYVVVDYEEVKKNESMQIIDTREK